MRIALAPQRDEPADVGAVAVQAFESVHRRFDKPVSFVHLHVPFKWASVKRTPTDIGDESAGLAGQSPSV